MTVYAFNKYASARLTAALSVAGTVAHIGDGDYQAFLSGAGSTSKVVALLLNASASEIVEIDAGSSSRTNGLVLSRGKEGTNSPAGGWAKGTLIIGMLTAGQLNNALQKADHRSVDYNPNGVLTAAYAGEKIYQEDEALWWKSVVVSTEWRLIVGAKTVATPSISPEGGTHPTGAQVTLASTTPGAVIRYTLDGTDPTEESTLYSSPFYMPDDAETTLKAKAFHADRWWTDSAVASADFICGTVDTPVMDPVAGSYANGQEIAITCGTVGASIYYTLDGSDPTDAGTLYTGPVQLPDNSNTTVKAKAYKGNVTASAIASATYATNQCDDPEFSPAAGTHYTGQEVTITCATAGAIIYYTTDGSDPDQSDTMYTGPITLPGPATTTIKAKAFHASMAASDIATAQYTTIGTWVEKTSDSFWSGEGGTTWNGAEWSGVYYPEDGQIVVKLVAAGEWPSAYRPYRMRVTFVGAGTRPGAAAVFWISPEGEIDSRYVGFIESGASFGLDFSSGLDIGMFFLGASTVTKIEFLE